MVANWISNSGRWITTFHCFIVALFMMMSCADNDGIATSTVEMKYSSLLTLSEGDGYVVAQIRNPWDTTKVLHSYVLVNKEQPVSGNLPEGEVLKVPISSAVVTTSVHCSLLQQLQAYHAISGVCDVEYIYLQQIRQDVKAGRIRNIGNSMSPDIEQLIELSPEAVLVSPFENSGNYGKLGKTGIPLVECADYMETSPLGRAEWMRFFGMLFGCRQQADSLFAAVEDEYNTLKSKASSVTEKPTVVTDTKTGATWYVAGANSTTGQLIADAGGNYVFSDEMSSGSVPYSPEKVFDKAQDADLWIVKYNQDADKTLAQLGSEWPLNTQMKAYKEGGVYGCNLAKTMYYEESPFHPELLLRDYINMLHPTLLHDNELRYFKQMR